MGTLHTTPGELGGNTETFLATAAGMPTASPALMRIRTRFAAIILAVFLDRFAEIHDTKTRLTSTFHLSYGSHLNLLKSILHLL